MQKNRFLPFIISIILCSNISFAQSFNGHEYVDLGLPSGTKWAKCNIDAKTEIDFGGYYAFAETVQKNEYTIDNYKVGKTIKTADSSYIDKDGFTHKIIGKDIFDIAGTAYDVATVKWGKGWCMPTKEQFDELKYNCKWEWVSKNGVSGYKVTGKANGKYIFLPAGGEQNANGPLYIGSNGYYWTDSYSHSNYALYLHFNSYYYSIKEESRNNGLLVRPVYDIKGDTTSEADIMAKYEEQFLREKYGDNYDDAMSRTSDDYIDNSRMQQYLSSEQPRNVVKSAPMIYAELDNKQREATCLHIPLFTCEGSGQVVVRISIASTGKVTSAEVVSKNLTSDEECLSNAAISAALRSSFSRISGNNTEYGKITYNCVNQ